jgi:hypothetical protein
MTDTAIDLDDFKEAWRRLDRRLDAQHALAFQVFRDGRIRSLRRRLWPLYGGQVLQSILGVVTIAAGVYGWGRHLDLPYLVVAGAVLHAYGVALLMAAGRTIWMSNRIDYAAPVVAIQRQLADLRAWYVRSSLWLGLAWWFLWMPCFMVLAAAVGVDVWRRAPRLFAFGALIGVAGLLLMAAAHRLATRPGWRWLAALNDDAMAGASVRRAQAVLDEIRRFQDEGEVIPPAESTDTFRAL